jgi:hypothetical protein
MERGEDEDFDLEDWDEDDDELDLPLEDEGLGGDMRLAGEDEVLSPGREEQEAPEGGEAQPAAGEEPAADGLLGGDEGPEEDEEPLGEE